MHEDDKDDEDDWEEILRSFLESYPLYAACRLEMRQAGRRQSLTRLNHWPEAITLVCKRCRRETTWKRVDCNMEAGRRVDVPFDFYEDNYVLRYTCARCDEEHAGFWCLVESTETTHCVRKQGQSPAWSIEPVVGISKALPPEAAEFYRKGLICTSHNFGLGAVGYFRRVVESVTGHLLDLVEAHAMELSDQATVDAIADARRSHQATDRLKYAADQLPATLRPGGANPLARLYESYSEGIHSLTDEECLEVARDVQAGLDYLLPNLNEQLAAARAYQKAMTKAKRRK